MLHLRILRSQVEGDYRMGGFKQSEAESVSKQLSTLQDALGPVLKVDFRVKEPKAPATSLEYL